VFDAAVARRAASDTEDCASARREAESVGFGDPCRTAPRRLLGKREVTRDQGSNSAMDSTCAVCGNMFTTPAAVSL